MKDSQAMHIPMQVGTELRISNQGEVRVGNPELELADERIAADAVLSYRFDTATKEHVLSLLDPVANRAHMGRHHRAD